MFERQCAQMQTQVSPRCALCALQPMRRSLKAEPPPQRSASAFHSLFLMFPDKQRRQSTAAKRGQTLNDKVSASPFRLSFCRFTCTRFARSLTGMTRIVAEAELVAKIALGNYELCVAIYTILLWKLLFIDLNNRKHATTLSLFYFVKLRHLVGFASPGIVPEGLWSRPEQSNSTTLLNWNEALCSWKVLFIFLL